MKMKCLAGLLLAIACLAPLSPAQSFWDSSDAYLGQVPPSDKPKIFAPGRLADSGTFIMGRVAFSRDGKEFYYTQNDSWESAAHARMKMIRYTDHHWSVPAVIN